MIVECTPYPIEAYSFTADELMAFTSEGHIEYSSMQDGTSVLVKVHDLEVSIWFDNKQIKLCHRGIGYLLPGDYMVYNKELGYHKFIAKADFEALYKIGK